VQTLDLLAAETSVSSFRFAEACPRGPNSMTEDCGNYGTTPGMKWKTLRIHVPLNYEVSNQN
jgi:hypothetical protein